MINKIKLYIQYLKEVFTKRPEKPKVCGVIKYSDAWAILKPHTQHLFLSDPNYILPNKLDAERFSSESLIKSNKYLTNAYDCDNFSYSMKGFWSDSLSSYAFGIAWSQKHAFNVCIDENKKLWIVEPQNNRWYSLAQIKNRPMYYPFRVVII